MNVNKNTYLGNIKQSFLTLGKALKLTFGHLRRAAGPRRIVPIQDEHYFHHTEGIATVQYPHEMIPVPDNGRYRLHNEIDDCIVCDKCAKICPVDCIEIEAVRAVEEIGKTSDGTPKRIHAARFDIDMAKCCFCGLCTTVCPTECLTMTKVFDFSVTDIREHTFEFAEMSEAEIAEKKRLLEEHQKARAERPQPAPTPSATAPAKPAGPKPAFKPRIKPPGPPKPPSGT